MLITRFFLFYLTLFNLAIISATAQETPRVINFTKDQYQAYNQNWSIAQTPDLSMFFANSAGLLQFDGSVWRTYPLPNRQVIRSIASDGNGRIFTGAFSEFGYWQEDKNGDLKYYSLSHLIKDEIFLREEIWRILPLNNAVLFQSFSKIYLYDYKEVRSLVPPGNIMFAHQTKGGRLILPVIHSGLFELQHNNSFKLIPGSEILADRTVVCIISLNKDEFLVGTANNGIYEYRNGQFHRWNNAIQQQVIANQLNRAIRLSDGNLALGTILNGVYIINPEGKLLYHINQQNGLQNNTVLALHEDAAQNLWVGLDKGIDLVELSSPLTFFKDKNGTVGAVYAATIHEGNLYIGSNQGVFVKPWQHAPTLAGAEEFRLINGTQGQVWELKVLDEQLLLGHNEGTFIIKNGQVQQISDITGGWMTIRHPQKPDVLLQATYTGLVVFNKDHTGAWQFSHRVGGGLQESIKKIVFDKEGNLWAASPHRGLYRIQLDDSLKQIVAMTNFTTRDGLPSEFKIDIDQIDNQLVIKSNSHFLTFDPESNTFTSLKKLKSSVLPKGDFRIKAGKNDNWFQIGDHQLTYYTPNHNFIFNLPLVPDYESIMAISDYHYLFGLDDGYAIFSPNPKYSKIEKIALPPVSIKMVKSFNRNHHRKHLKTSEILQLSANENNLHFYFAQPVFTHTPEYSYLLEGFDEVWSAWQTSPEKEFNRLPPGDYIFKVKSSLSEEVATFQFSIQPHWYQSWWAAILYILLLITGIWLIERWNQHRLEKQRLHLEQDKEKQLEEQRIKAANERLQFDVINKSKELANSTMSLIQKNEILMKIKEEIQQVKAASDGHFPSRHYQRLLHLIDTNISSEDDWQVFETNFNQVHEQFFKKLKSEFPELTPGDLKLAAYLKMNLASKEIAPLLNISVRSVENKRYRLRKKLNLQEEDNLTEFMLQY